MKKWMTILASLLLLSGCGAKEDTFSLSAAEQEAYEESIDKVTEDFYWEYDHSSLSFGAAVCRRRRRKMNGCLMPPPPANIT